MNCRWPRRPGAIALAGVKSLAREGAQARWWRADVFRSRGRIGAAGDDRLNYRLRGLAMVACLGSCPTVLALLTWLRIGGHIRRLVPKLVPQQSTKQKGQSEDWPFCLNLLVRPERFERPTPWFVAKY
jgi:hypothetical protein